MSSPPLLSFALITPGFAVAGLLLAVVPIVIHIFNRRRFRTVDWAAMYLLQLAMRKNQRQMKFENWLLLAMRCLVLALFGLALSRPTGCDKSSLVKMGGRTGLHIFVIDNGLSMAYLEGSGDKTTHLDKAKLLAAGMIDRLNPGGESVVIITGAKPATAVAALPTYDLQQAKGILSRIPQCYGSTDLAAALHKAGEVARDQEQQPEKFLYIFTDAAASEWQTSDSNQIKTEAIKLAAQFHITHFNLSTGPQWNQAIEDLHPTANIVTTRALFGSDFIASAKGFGRPHEATVQWKIDGQILPATPAIQLDAVSKPQILSQANLNSLLSADGAGGTHVIAASVIGDDRLPADNTRNKVVTVVSQLKTLIVEGEHQAGKTGGSGLNLQVALAGLKKSGSSEGLVMPEVISDLELSGHILSDYRVVALCAVTQISASQGDQLAEFVKHGGTLMIFLSSNILPENYNSVLLPRKLLPGPLIKRMLAAEGKSFNFNFNPNGDLHPLLRAFAHQQNTGLETAQAFGYWQVDCPYDPQLRVLNWKALPGQIVARDGAPLDPAITQQTLGDGRIVLVSTSANEEWISFTRKPVYTELMNELVSGSVNAGDGWMNLNVGDPLVIPPTMKLTATPKLTDPASNPITLQWTTTSDNKSVYQSPALALPGLYSLTTGSDTLPIAVNVPPESSDVHTLDDESLKSALGNVEVRLRDGEANVLSANTSPGGDWAWPVMFAVLLMTLAESIFANRCGHRPSLRTDI